VGGGAAGTSCTGRGIITKTERLKDHIESLNKIRGAMRDGEVQSAITEATIQECCSPGDGSWKTGREGNDAVPCGTETTYMIKGWRRHGSGDRSVAERQLSPGVSDGLMARIMLD